MYIYIKLAATIPTGYA